MSFLLKFLVAFGMPRLAKSFTCRGFATEASSNKEATRDPDTSFERNKSARLALRRLSGGMYALSGKGLLLYIAQAKDMCIKQTMSFKTEAMATVSQKSAYITRSTAKRTRL